MTCLPRIAGTIAAPNTESRDIAGALSVTELCEATTTDQSGRVWVCANRGNDWGRHYYVKA